MKKIFITVLFIFIVALCGCGDSKQIKQEYNEPSSVVSEFTMVMEERNSFYYPTIKGSVISPVYPTKMEAFFGDEVFELDNITGILQVGNGYLVSFDTVHIFGRLDQGDYRVRLKAYSGEKYYILDSEAIFTVDELYTGMCGVNFETGEQIDCMDKESNWSPCV